MADLSWNHNQAGCHLLRWSLCEAGRYEEFCHYLHEGSLSCQNHLTETTGYKLFAPSPGDTSPLYLLGEGPASSSILTSEQTEMYNIICHHYE